MRKEELVLMFPKNYYDLETLMSKTHEELYQWYRADKDVYYIDSLKVFADELTQGLLDVNKYHFIHIEITR